MNQLRTEADRSKEMMEQAEAAMEAERNELQEHIKTAREEVGQHTAPTPVPFIHIHLE